MDEREVQRLLDEQASYYRARAVTYDIDMAWDSDDPELRELVAPVHDWFGALPVAGGVLEIGCGTGAWTQRLAARAAHVHAIDVAPEMLERAESRTAGMGNVTFEVADIYHWRPSATYDLVFFSFLLTHVPTVKEATFWEVVTSSLADDGNVAFVDAAPHRHDEEEWLDDGIVRRVLRDGSEHRIVKVFPTPQQITRAMTAHGLHGTVKVLSDDFLVGVGRRTTASL